MEASTLTIEPGTRHGNPGAERPLVKGWVPLGFAQRAGERRTFPR